MNITEINREIKALEDCDCTTYSVCNKLAILYIIRDHYKGEDSMAVKSSPIETKMSSSMPGTTML